MFLFSAPVRKIRKKTNFFPFSRDNNWDREFWKLWHSINIFLNLSLCSKNKPNAVRSVLSLETILREKEITRLTELQPESSELGEIAIYEVNNTCRRWLMQATVQASHNEYDGSAKFGQFNYSLLYANCSKNNS